MTVGLARSPPATPLPRAARWSDRLAEIAAGPLEFCPEFPAIAGRFERWWTRAETDRPVFVATCNTDPHRPVTRRLELLDNPQLWFEAKRADLARTRCVGDGLPSVRIDFGPAALGALLGAPLQITSDTAWTGAFIRDDWSNAPRWNLHDEHPRWRTFCELLDLVAEDAAGRYLVCLPDLGGGSDPLLNMRGAEQLCLDALDRPDRIREALDAIYPTWRLVIERAYDVILGHGAGLIHWLMVWSSRPCVLPTCDFNFMLGPQTFRDLCLPDIARLAATTARAVFHTDGPQAAKHVDALLEVPDITAIQFTPGTGTPSALPWLEMFRNIQRAGKALLVTCPLEEVLRLSEQLEPRGLAFLVDDPVPDRTEQVLAELCRYYGC